jgi:hypothetical protein
MGNDGAGGSVMIGFNGEGKKRGARFGHQPALVPPTGEPQEEKRWAHAVRCVSMGTHPVSKCGKEMDGRRQLSPFDSTR